MRIIGGTRTANVTWVEGTLEDAARTDKHGVYVIWSDGGDSLVPFTIWVGQGNVSKRVADHKKKSEILKYAKDGDLFISWASVPESYRNGVERFLADKCRPLEGDHHPRKADPIVVNLPF